MYNDESGGLVGKEKATIGSAAMGAGDSVRGVYRNGRHLSVGSPENDVLGLIQESRK